MGKGTGLGLATVYGIVKQNNGFINIYSEPGQGTAIKIYLPRLVLEDNKDKRSPQHSRIIRGHETILLAEDDPAILKMTNDMLKRMGYHVLVANLPEKAIEIAREYGEKIHLLLTDVIMPQMNGRLMS